MSEPHRHLSYYVDGDPETGHGARLVVPAVSGDDPKVEMTGDDLARIRAERDEALAEAERMRLVLALQGEGVDPNGYYEGTPGHRLRQLLTAEAERDAAVARAERLEALERAARAWRHWDYLHATEEDRAKPLPSHVLIAAVDALDPKDTP